MFNLTPQELSRTIWNIDDYQLAPDDTLTTEHLKSFRDFFKRYSERVFNIKKSSAIYSFPTQSYKCVYNRSKGEYEYTYFEKIEEHDYLCHYYWTAGAKPDFTKGLINIFPNNVRPEINAEFWKYLLSPTESPYRDVLKDIWIIRSPDKATKGFPMGILWSNVTNTNALLLTHMLITSRLLTGWALDIVFYRLLEMGFSKPVALLLSVLFEFNEQTVTSSESFGPHFKAKSVPDSLTAIGPHCSDQPFGRVDYDHEDGRSSWMTLSPRRFINGDYAHEPENKLADAKLTETNHLWFGETKVLKGKLGSKEDEPEYDYDTDEYIESNVSYNDVWGLFDQVAGRSPVDIGIVKEIEHRMQNDIPLNFNVKD